MSKPILSLKQFLLRQQVLNLYRRILKSTRRIPDQHYQKELFEWARDDFRNNSHHTDETTIKMLLTHGERALKELESSIDLAK